MARTSPSPESSGSAGELRLFLALDLPDSPRAGIGRWRDSIVSGRPELRPVRDESLHVTLVFLGRRPSDLVSELWGITTGALARLDAPRLAPAGLAAVPPRRPRLLALGLEDRAGGAAAVHGALGGALAQAGLYEPETRAFWPHVTVARVRGRSRVRGVEAPRPPGGAFTRAAVTLYRSDLHPSGARYVALERLELAGSGD